MVPGIVRNHGELGSLHQSLAARIGLYHLSVNLDGLHVEINIAQTLDLTLGHAETGLARHQEIEDAETSIVGTLCTIYQRTTLNSDATAIVGNMHISLDGTNGHIEMNGNHIAFLPLTIDAEIAHRALSLHLLTIHLDTVAAQHIVAETIEVAGNRLSVDPSWYAYHHLKGFGLRLLDLYRDITIPRIVGLLLQYDILATHLDGSRVACKEVDIKLAILHSIHIAGERRDEATEVGRTAGTAKPRLALGSTIGIELILTVRRQRIGIEEAASVHTHTTDDTIVQGTLHTVNVFGITM